MESRRNIVNIALNLPFIRPLCLLSATCLLSACGEWSDIPDQSAACDGNTHEIASVQGDGFYSPFEDQSVMVRGVVTLVQDGQGFYLEEEGDGKPAERSRALFVADRRNRLAAQPGLDLLIGGTISEEGERRDKLTTLTPSGNGSVCASSAELPLTRVALPLGNRQREALEGMRVSLRGEMAITDTYSAYRGQLTVSAGSSLQVPTEVSKPGKSAAAVQESNRANSITVKLQASDVRALAASTPMTGITGVLGHDGRNAVLLLDSAPTAGDVPLPQVPPAPAPGTLRVVNSNLLNFFNGDGLGGGFPTERGAKSPDEFERQKGRLGSAMAALQPDLLAVQELENDGFGPHSAATTMIELLQSAGNGPWAVVKPPGKRIGDDVITVGLFYRVQALQPDGPPQLLQSDPFLGRSRQPLAQVFRVRDGGARLLVVANHLKSKGSCPDDGPNADQGDGQGCWNPARTAAVNDLLPWLTHLEESAGIRNTLIMGDMNAWRLEDPIRGFIRAGYVDLVEQLSGLPQHSYRYFGQAGTLDYAFASESLAGQATAAFNWNINADWPRNMELPQPWLRMSDHDPVVVDFDFNQSATSD